MTNLNIKFTLIVGAFIFAILSSCSSGQNQEFEYRPLASFQNDTSAIQPNSKVRILGFSGSIDKNLDAIYYSQILVVNLSNEDTLSILCPTFKIPSTDNSVDYELMSPTQFDPNKKINEASYERIDSSTQIALQVIDEAMYKPVDESDFGKTIVTDFKDLSKKELVAVNKTIPLFARQYKTVIGVLRFSVDVRK